MALEIPAQFNIASWFLDRPAAAHPERIAILGEPREIRYADLHDLANRCGNALRAMGCAAGDRVLIILHDSAEFIAAFFGAAKIGAIPVPVNPLRSLLTTRTTLQIPTPASPLSMKRFFPNIFPRLKGREFSSLLSAAVWRNCQAFAGRI